MNKQEYENYQSSTFGKFQNELKGFTLSDSVFTLDVSWDTLKTFGFNPLTSEADALSFRMLVDLNDNAINLFSQFIGGVQFTNSNYNPESKKSCFIAGSMLRELIIFCVISLADSYDCDIIITNHNKDDYSILVFNCNDENFRDTREYNKHSTGRLYRLWNSNRRGMSNVHAMSGRSQ